MIGVKRGAWIYLIVLLISLTVEGFDVPLTLVQDAVAKGAVCLDGSPPAYHFAPGFGSGVDNWLVHMEGGGWCSNVEECKQRTKNFRGSSKYMEQLSFSGILGNKQTSSPGIAFNNYFL
uniref:Pectin acetylesterase n=1 Tax=Elaeis guineensis var. tenera TaxID=51953 RepID=A0A6I9RVE3_ELAGV|nr:pectin acetylesterase 7 [Elaeis guineensis]